MKMTIEQTKAACVASNIERGDVVVVKKGATVRSLNRGLYVLQRQQQVKVHLVLQSFTQDEKLFPAEISWAGSGGYWCYANIADVLRLENTASPVPDSLDSDRSQCKDLSPDEVDHPESSARPAPSMGE